MNKDGTLDVTELQRFGVDCVKFITRDSKKDNFLVRLVVKGQVKQMDRDQFIDWCIQECDSDKSGSVSYAEFKQFVATHSSWESFQIVEGTYGR